MGRHYYRTESAFWLVVSAFVAIVAVGWYQQWSEAATAILLIGLCVVTVLLDSWRKR